MTKMDTRFQIFTLSKEESNCPLVPQLIELGIELYQLFGKTKGTEITMSMPYGKRVLINTSDTVINHLSRSDFIEIVDYDPVRNILLFIGQKQPHEMTPIHWIIHNAKPEIASLVFIREKTNSIQFPKTISQTVQEEGTLFEMAKIVLKNLQNKPVIHIQERGVLITGKSIAKVKETIHQYMGRNQ